METLQTNLLTDSILEAQESQVDALWAILKYKEIKLHIIITRPIEDSLFLIERLKKLGHMVTHLPVIKIEELKTEKINFQNFQFFLILFFYL